MKPTKQIPEWANMFSRLTGLIIALSALVLLSACSDASALETCQETHSFETCVYLLR